MSFPAKGKAKLHNTFCLIRRLSNRPSGFSEEYLQQLCQAY